MVELAKKRPGDQVRLDYIRYGQRHQATVKLGEFTTEAARQRPRPERTVESSSRLGFSVGTPGQQIAARCGLRSTNGVYPTEVDPYGPAADLNLSPCMEITSINGQQVRTNQDVERVARTIKPGDAVSLVVRSPDEDGREVQRIINYRLSR
jgi:serine protease Do